MSDEHTPLSRAERQQAMERASKATPGSWETERGIDSYCIGAQQEFEWLPIAHTSLETYGMALQNADFIAHARADIPRYEATVQALEAEIAVLNRQANGLDGKIVYLMEEVERLRIENERLKDAFRPGGRRC